MTNEVIQRTSDEFEVRNLLAKLAQLSDEGDLDEYIECFTQDAHWGGAGFPERKGRPEILAGARERRASGIAGPGTHTRHVLTTSIVRVAKDTTECRSVFLFYSNTQAKPVLEMMGVWQDEIRRTSEGWKLARRSILRSE